MIINNIQVYQEAGFIKIKFESTDLQMGRVLVVRQHSPTVQEIMLSEFYYSNPTLVTDALNRKAERVVSFEVTFQSKRIASENAFSIYQLPKDPHMALDFLVALAIHAENMQFDYIQFNPSSARDYFTNKVSIPGANTSSGVTMEQYLKEGKFETDSYLKELAKRILDISPCIEYQSVQLAMREIVRRSDERKDVNFTVWLEANERFRVLTGIETHDNLFAEKPKETTAEKIKAIIDLEKKFLRESEKDHLNYLINQIHFRAKKKLFAPCLGRQALDEGEYKWTYTEWELLKHTQFGIRPDGKVGITKLKENLGYKKHYAKGQRNHTIFEVEMRHLAPFIGLEFDQSCAGKFHDGIIFTKACSEKLIAEGLHIDQAYLKKMLTMKNKWGLFRQGRDHSQDKEGNSSYFYQMPVEIIELILDYTCPELKGHLDKREALEIQQMALPRVLTR